MANPLLYAGLALCLAGFVQGLSGFGFGLVAMAILPALLDFHTASLVVVLFTVPVSLTSLAPLRRHCNWRLGWTLWAGMMCGIPVGLYLMVHAPAPLLIRALGAILIGLSIQELALPRRVVPFSNAMGFPMGLVGGVMGGAFNMGGPPAVAYLYSRPWPKEQIVAILQVAFVLSAFTRLAVMGGTGMFTAPVLRLGLWSAVPVVAAVFFGSRLLRRIPQTHLRRGVFIFLGLMGARYLIAP